MLSSHSNDILLNISYMAVKPSVLWHCWLGNKKGIQPEKKKKAEYWYAGCGDQTGVKHILEADLLLESTETPCHTEWFKMGPLTGRSGSNFGVDIGKYRTWRHCNLRLLRGWVYWIFLVRVLPVIATKVEVLSKLMFSWRYWECDNG